MYLVTVKVPKIKSVINVFQIKERSDLLVVANMFVLFVVVSEETPLVPRQGKKRENENSDEFS